eukprot:199915_1
MTSNESKESYKSNSSFSSYNKSFNECMQEILDQLEHYAKINHNMNQNVNDNMDQNMDQKVNQNVNQNMEHKNKQKQLFSYEMKLEFILLLQQKGICPLSAFEEIYNHYDIYKTDKTYCRQILLNQFPIAIFNISKYERLRFTVNEPMVMLTSFPDNNQNVFMMQLIQFLNNVRCQQNNQIENARNMTAEMLHHIYQKTRFYNRNMTAIDIKNIIFNLFDQQYCHEVMGLDTLTNENIDKLNQSNWFQFDGVNNEAIAKHEKRTERLKTLIKQLQKKKDANNFPNINKIDQTIISYQLEAYKRNEKRQKNQKDKLIANSRKRKRKEIKENVINALDKHNIGNVEGIRGKIANKELVKFIVDLESGRYENNETHPRRHFMAILLDIERTKKGKLLFNQIFVYSLMFIAVSEQICKDNNIDMDDVTNQQVREYLDKNQNHDDLLSNAVFDDKYTPRDISTITKFFSHKIEYDGITVDVSFKKNRKSYYIKIHPNKQYNRRQNHDVLLNLIKYQPQHLHNVLIVSSDELTTLKHDHVTQDNCRNPGSLTISFQMELDDGTKEEYAIKTNEVRASSEFVDRVMFQKVTSHCIMKPSLQLINNMEKMLRCGNGRQNLCTVCPRPL